MGTYANFYNSDNGDRVYDADSFSEWLRPFFKTGVFNGELQVLASSGMEVIVNTGNAFIEGKLKKFDAQTTLTVEQASANSTRIDAVVCRRNDTDRDFTLMVVKGSTVAPLPVRENGIYDIVLAHITVPASAVEIKQENITDTRMNADICGWVVSNVEEVDFDQVTAQWADYIANFEADELQAFNEWFDTIKGQLSTDQAGSLQLQIDEQANKIATNTANISANKADIDSISADITSLQQTTETNTSDIQAIKTHDDEQDSIIATNTNNIATNTNDITRLNKFSIITLGTSWVQDTTNGYYTQTVALSGITSNDNPIIDVVLSDTLENMQAQQEDWSKILKVETSTDALIFYASEPTSVELNLIVKIGVGTKSDADDIQTELIDIRVGYDGTTYGTTYDSAGNAVRTQVTTLNTKINDTTSELNEKADKVEVSELKSDLANIVSKNKPNLFDGNFLTGYVQGRADGLAYYIPNRNGKSIVITIKPNTQYSIIKEAGCLDGGYYYLKVVTYKESIDRVLESTIDPNTGAICDIYAEPTDKTLFTFTSGPDDHTLCITVAKTLEPYVEVLEGLYTEFQQSGYDDVSYIPNKLLCYTKEETEEKIKEAIINNHKLSKTTDEIIISQGKSEYIIGHNVNLSINLDTWMVKSGSINNELIWSGTDIEGPIKQVGADDFCGGVHGDEKYTSVTFILDGVGIDENAIVSEKEFSDFVMYVTSNIYFCNDTENIAFERHKKVEFKDNKVIISNQLKYVGSGNFSVFRWPACGSYSVYKDQMIGYDTNYDCELINDSDTSENKLIDTVCFYGNNYSVTVKALSNKYNQYLGWVQYFSTDTRPRFKAYLDAINNQAGECLLSNGDILIASYEVEIN